MILRAVGVLVLASAMATAAPVPKELKARTDAQRIQGVWAAENIDGRALGQWYFDGEKLFAGGTEYGITLRAEGTPREMDLSQRGRLDYGCIYKFVGEDLHIAYFGGAKRPADFKQVQGIFLHVLKRLPEGKK